MSQLELRLEPRQSLRMTPQMLQAMQMLIMPAQELARYLEQVTESNPLLEQGERIFFGRGQDLASRTDEPDPGWERGAWDEAMDSLSTSLSEQLHRCHPDKQVGALCSYMIGLLDENGYLEEEDLQSLYRLDMDPELIQRALALLQSLEPVGVGARSVEECLLLQLQRRSPREPVAEEIVARCLPLLADGAYRAIARQLQRPESEVRRACDLIRQLDPHPGAGEASAGTPEYVIPDVIVTEADGQWCAVLNDRYLPRFSLSQSYLRLLAQTDEEEVRRYLQDKLRQARWVLSCLEKRQATLQACADLILRTQMDYFRGSTAHLAPMTMRSAAGMLQMHESTVGRCVRGKYLQCRQGVFPLRYFFSGQVNHHSGQALRTEISALIAGEDPRKPLSDQAIADLLEKKGMIIARRTVAKYREAMHLPPAGRRKRNT